MWSKNPIPPCDGFLAGAVGTYCVGPAFPPPRGCNDTCWGYQALSSQAAYVPDVSNVTTVEIPDIVDTVRIPEHLAPGDYLLNWRWDCEHTPQIWGACADVSISVA